MSGGSNTGRTGKRFDIRGVCRAGPSPSYRSQPDLYESYHVCSCQPLRISELGETVADALQKPRNLLQWGKRPYRTDEPMWVVGDNRRFVSVTSWRPAFTPEEEIRRTIFNRRRLRQSGEHNMRFDQFRSDYERVLDRTVATSGEGSAYFAA
jgi:hypothetical protein